MTGCLDLWAIVPELILAGLALLLVPVAGLARGRWQQVPTVVAALGLVAALGFTARMLLWPEQAVFCETYAVDGFGTVFKLLTLLGALISLMAIASHFRGTVQAAHAPVALLFSTVGGVLLVSSLDLGLIVLFLQMLSMGSYVLVSLGRRDRSRRRRVEGIADRIRCSFTVSAAGPAGQPGGVAAGHRGARRPHHDPGKPRGVAPE